MTSKATDWHCPHCNGSMSTPLPVVGAWHHCPKDGRNRPYQAVKAVTA